MDEKKDFYYYIKDQFMYGGKKYALAGNSLRESTDDLFDDFGKNWLIGTLGKYIMRFKNVAREKDILKIANYMYIIWLKRGFYIDDKRIAPIDTNLENKADNFDTFLNRFTEYNNNIEKITVKLFKTDAEVSGDEEAIKILNTQALDSVYDLLKKIAWQEWTDLQESRIFDIFRAMRIMWNRNFGHKEEHDLDTYNEEKNERRTTS